MSLLLAGCATNPVSGGKDFVLMTEEQELALGREYSGEVLRQIRSYDDPELQAYVDEIIERLGRQSHRPDLIYRAKVLDSPEVNAFALPGGYLYITRGIMAYMNSEAQLAGVLGHEIGHVTARHGVRQHAAAQGLGLLGLIIVATARTPGVGDLTNILGAALVRGYGREHELEADRLGAEYLARSDLDPEEMIEVVGILKDQEVYEKQIAEEEGREPSVYHGVFATHPDNDQRLQEVISAAERLRVSDPAPPTPVDREAFLRRIDGLVIGAGAHEGVQRGRHFYHQTLDFTLSFPQNWKIENRPERLIASTKDNSAMIQLSSRDLNKRQTPEAFMRKLYEKKDFANGEAFSTADFSGYTGIAQLDTPFGRRSTRVAAIFRDNSVFMFACATDKKAGAATWDTAFLDTIRSLRKLRPEELELAEPKRIKLLTAQPGDTFDELARGSVLGPRAADQLRFLNGLYPDGEPSTGQLLKIVE